MRIKLTSIMVDNQEKRLKCYQPPRSPRYDEEGFMHDSQVAPRRSEASQFDFLEGEWSAVCRSPRVDATWGEGPGTLKATKILDGLVSMEFFEGPYQGKVIKGLGLRAFNPQNQMWEHTWTDTSSPGGFIVWRGRFEGDHIDLFGEWKDADGHEILSRLTWSHITQRTAHWESHRSADGGNTWVKHWVVDFTRQ